MNGLRVGVRYMSSQAVVPRVCVVGSGPAAFYTVQYLVENNDRVEVDMFERLPVPFGLIRYGVAPDHPQIKITTNAFTKIAQNPRLRFYGNVSLGNDVSLKDLQHAYHAVILAYGAERDRLLHVPGEDLDNVVSARRFVGWYNGLPDDKDLPVSLDTDTAVVIGQGNVAIDIARILLQPVDMLKNTDIAEHALSALACSRVRRVVLVGRRGPMQVAFTSKELRDLTQLPLNIQFIPGQMDDVPKNLKGLPRVRQRLTQLLLKTAIAPANASHDKLLELMFLRSPVSFQGIQRVCGVELAVNTLRSNGLEEPVAVATETRETVQCGLALRSIGYKSVAADPDVPFDHSRCVVVQKPGLYATGWVATGPTGIILNTMSAAVEVGQVVNQDLKTGVVDCSQHKPGGGHILALLRDKGVPTVDFAGWQRIDEVEKSRGALVGKPREKIVDIAEMLEIGATPK